MSRIVAGFPFIDLVARIPGHAVITQSFHGPRGEVEADKWLAKHVLTPRGVSEWYIDADIALDSGRVLAFTQVVSYGRTNSTLRQAAIQAMTHRGLNRRLDAQQQAEARFLAEEISGKTYADLYPPARNWMAVAGAMA